MYHTCDNPTRNKFFSFMNLIYNPSYDFNLLDYLFDFSRKFSRKYVIIRVNLYFLATLRTLITYCH